ncbi:multidrug transporter subunit MdtN [Sesbania bispinosa]|nr:multidrug transporter subunit MdtN [Sesbania bispinosa]
MEQQALNKNLIGTPSPTDQKKNQTKRATYDYEVRNDSNNVRPLASKIYIRKNQNDPTTPT